MTCRQRLIDLFEAEGVTFRIHAHAPTYTAQQEAGAQHIAGARVAKVVVAFVQDEPIMLVLPAHRPVDFQAVEKLLGREPVRLGQEHEFATLFPDCEVGAMPPFGNLYGLPTYLDTELTMQTEVTFLVGNHRESVTIPTAELERLSGAVSAPLARQPVAKPAR